MADADPRRGQTDEDGNDRGDDATERYEEDQRHGFAEMRGEERADRDEREVAERELARPPGEDGEREGDDGEELDASVQERSPLGDEQRRRHRNRERDTGAD